MAAAGDVPWVREYTPLATVAWAESVGSAAADAVGVMVERMRAGVPLADALVEAIGTGTAAALLGPLESSDVLVGQAEQTLNSGGQRWLWRGGGWSRSPRPFT